MYIKTKNDPYFETIPFFLLTIGRVKRKKQKDMINIFSHPIIMQFDKFKSRILWSLLLSSSVGIKYDTSTMNNKNVEYIKEINHIATVLRFWVEI
jgi:hypothetical protein